MTRGLELGGWLLAIGAALAAGAARYRMAKLAEAVARTCHEVRGPLTAVRLGLTLAARTGQLVDARMSAIELELGRATLALEDLSRARGPSGPTGQPLERIDVAQLLTESIEAWRGFAAAHAARVRLLECRDRPAVLGERLRLAQAVGNVIANAIEHGGGEIDVSCRVTQTWLAIEVQDDGPGLPVPVSDLADRRVLWAAWRNRRNSGRRGHGLAIASAVAAAHGGRLASAPSERGARLVLEIPLASPTTPPARPRALAEDRSGVASAVVHRGVWVDKLAFISGTLGRQFRGEEPPGAEVAAGGKAASESTGQPHFQGRERDEEFPARSGVGFGPRTARSQSGPGGFADVRVAGSGYVQRREQ